MANSPATEVSIDRLKELVFADEPEYPNDTLLMPADLPGLDESISRAQERKVPILIIYPDGRERFIPAPSEVVPS